jgi:hypothetical protein
MSYVGASLLVVGFLATAHLLGIVDLAASVFARSREALADLRNPDLDDDAKERALQGHAGKLFGAFLLLVLMFAIALVVPLGVLYLLDLPGWLPLEGSMDVAMSWPFLVASAVVITVAVIVLRRTRRARRFEHDYVPLDRLLHRIVFRTRSAQVAIADLEDHLRRKKLASIENRKPVFVTGVPRAGTTMLLDFVSDLPEFGSHVYRDMPFVLCPLFWNALSRRFRRTDAPRPRAHGDGMMVSLDSPEAFEEVIWKLFWPRQYRRDRIDVWATCDDEQFTGFLKSHMRKIVALRVEEPERGRYISKNNLNIARLATLPGILPSAVLVVPFRRPLQHAASLLRQHLRFLGIHEEDRFGRRYMADIGHYDFGANLRPVDFDGWLDAEGDTDRTTLGFWVKYWTAAYEHILRECEGRIHLVSYDGLCARPREVLGRLGEAIEAADPAPLMAHAETLREPVAHPVDTDGIDPAVLERAEDLHERLRSAAIG